MPSEEYEYLNKCLDSAIYEHLDRWADHSLSLVLGLPWGLERDNLLNFALRAASWESNARIAKRVLEEELKINSLDAPLQIACERQNIEIVTLVIESLIRKKTKDQQANATSPKTDGNPSSVYDRIQIDRARVLETSLQASIQRGFHPITAILLPPYLECAEAYCTDQDLAEKREILDKIDLEVYANLSRDQNFRFLSMEIPTTARQNILCRLRTGSAEEPTDVLFSAEDQTIDAHKDVLCYWSSYFNTIFRNEGRYSAHVVFKKELSAVAMKVVVDFIYSGIFVYHDGPANMDERLEDLAELLSVAHYFDIDALKHQIQICIDSERGL